MQAPTAERHQIETEVEQAFGFVPNLITDMLDTAPVLAKAYLAVSSTLEADGALAPRERQAVLLAVSNANGCDYCEAAHTAGGKAAGLDAATLQTIKSGDAPSDDRLAALTDAARQLLETRGRLSDDAMDAVLARGVTRAEIYEIIGLIAQKTISNWFNHLNGTEIDPQLQ